MIYEHPALTRLVFGFVAADELTNHKESNPMSIEFSLYAEKRAAESLMQSVRADLANIDRLKMEAYLERFALPRGISELFAYRLAAAGGVRVPRVELTQEPLNPSDWFSKEVPGGWCNSRRVPQALPIYHLANQDVMLPPAIKKMDNELRFGPLLGKTCPVDRAEYADFPEQMESDARLLSAAAWNSDQRLLGHAFRAFLYASYAHSSNCLADVKGQLWLIDHEKIMHQKTTDDIIALHTVANHSERILRACQRVCEITEDHIEASLSGIPWHFWRAGGVFNHENDAAKYFKQRLATWKIVFRKNC
ncbi:MAG TPA: hypothetical protein VKA60_21020 [Blastocatellia bacterium]|nr:hypothetical protein [Blastocatellia bacterium]